MGPLPQVVNGKRNVPALRRLADEGNVQRAEVLREDRDYVDPQRTTSRLDSRVGVQQTWGRVNP